MSWPLGKKQSPEHIAKAAAAKRGQKRLASTRAKIAAAKIGTRHSAETRAKISAANRSREARDLTKEQFTDFQLFVRKGCTKAEAAALARGA